MWFGGRPFRGGSLPGCHGNYFIAGPNSGHRFTGEYKATDHVYQQDNYADVNKDGQLNGRLVVAADFGSGDEAPTVMTNLTVTPQIAVTIESAQDAVSDVIAHAGCSLHRDAVDARLIDAVQSFGTRGKIIHDEAEAGGL